MGSPEFQVDCMPLPYNRSGVMIRWHESGIQANAKCERMSAQRVQASLHPLRVAAVRATWRANQASFARFDVAFPLEVLRATAAWMSALNAPDLTSSFS